MTITNGNGKKTSSAEKLKNMFSITKWHVIITIITVIILTGLTVPKFDYIRYPEVSQSASKNYVASKTIRIINTEKTGEALSSELMSVVPSLQIDKTMAIDTGYFENLIERYAFNVVEGLFKNIVNRGYYPESIPFAESNEIEITVIKSINDNLIKNIFKVQYNDLDIIFGEIDLKQFILEYFHSKNINEIEEAHLNLILNYFNENANVVFNKIDYNRQKNLIIKALSPIYDIINKNDIIISKGEEVTEKDVNILKAIRKHSWIINLRIFFAIFIFYFILFLIFYSYVYYYHFHIFQTIKLLILLSILFILPAGLLKLFIIFLSGSHFIEGVYNIIYILPFGVFPILTAILINDKIAISHNFINTIILTFIYTFTLSSFSEIYNYFNLLFLLVYFVSSYAGIILCIKVKGKQGIIKTGFVIGFTGCIIIFSFYLFTPEIGELYPKIKTISYISMLLNGLLLTPIFAVGLLPFLESLFKIITYDKLNELANLNLPIFKEMLFKTPGTYSHSVYVANLAEAAAEIIGENYLLARVGAYYHDLGKMSRPEYFIENKTDSEESKHERIKPTLSSSIIKSHVKIGMDIAQKLKLPKEIKDIIQEHHGTSVIKLFYKQALEEADINDVILEEEFRYPGPKPQTKISAIISLADVVEATVRSLNNPSPTRLEEIIHKSIMDKVIEGELDECPLTLKELTLIQHAFFKILMPLYHKRPQYPDSQEMKNLQKKKDNN